jgi:hypothetical protein
MQMFDPAIMAAFDMPSPPWRPQIVEERLWKSPQAAEFERFAKRQIASFEQYADEWFSQIKRKKADIEAMQLPYPMPPVYLAVLEDAIWDREAEAEDRAVQIARLRKRIDRDVKRMFAVDPSIAAVMRTVGQRLTAIDDRLVEGLLDLALYFRALKAEGDPASRGGEIFDDPNALQRHLESIISA